MQSLSLFLLSASTAYAYPWVASAPGVDSTLLKHDRDAEYVKRAAACPFNANHPGAAPYNSKYPYTGAQNGLPGSQVGGIKVPADGDTAHAYTAPTANDIRGPCPGLNAAANHNFLSHDGIVTFSELVDAQQNVYNVGYDLAVVLAVLGIATDGDVATGKLSIGCDATSRTALLPLLSSQPGLNGHNRFEGDTSLTRGDYYISNGDDYSFNGTLFAEMKSYADSISGGKFDRTALAAYRGKRYDESVATNPNFYFGPKSLLLYGAASFLYELFPSYGPEGSPDLATISSFFGAVQDSSAPGGWAHVPEKIPANWFSRRAPYSLVDVTVEILALYVANPKLFGGNVGVNNFDALPSVFGIITDGKLPTTAQAGDILCLVYQLVTDNTPSALGEVLNLSVDVLDWVLGKLNPVFENTGCALKSNT